MSRVMCLAIFRLFSTFPARSPIAAGSLTRPAGPTWARPGPGRLAWPAAGLRACGRARRPGTGCGRRSAARRDNPGPGRRADGDHGFWPHPRRRGRRVPVRARPDTTARTYAGTLERLAARVGHDRPLADVTDEELVSAAAGLWGAPRPPHLEPARRHRRSFLSWCCNHGWPAGDLHLAADRRTAPSDDSKAILQPELERLRKAVTSRCGNGRCGDCCTTPPPAPSPALPWTCPTLTWPTGRRGPALRAAISMSCTSRPVPPGSCVA